MEGSTKVESVDNIGKGEIVSFWAHLYVANERSLPSYMPKIFKQIGMMLESVDRTGEDLNGTFVRFKISLKITQPLVRGISICVKGEHVWLPIKYESLPVYCFSCGTIGHTHHNCAQSFDPNLKYSSCKLEEEEEEANTPSTLPFVIIKNILSRVPLKYLFKFKSVSKQWKSTISDPSFAEMHLQQSKNSSHRIALEDKIFNGFHVFDFKNRVYRFVAAQHSRRKYNLKCLLQNCDGLYLYKKKCKDASYLLCNPSTGAYREIFCPPSLDAKFYGLYYNPLVKDYNVVIGDTKYYAVFSCRHNKWSDVEEMKDFCSSDKPFLFGCPYNGSFYWLQWSGKFELICFDGGEESFKKVAMPELGLEKHDRLYMRCFGGNLCLFVMDYEVPRFMRIIKRVKGDEEDSWMEVKVQLPMRYSYYRPTCQISQDKILLDTESEVHLVYDQRYNTFEFIDIMRGGRECFGPLPFLENLFVV